jgi:hypothetical protein
MKLTKSQLETWRIASNRVSIESIKYAADIVGYTNLTTATIRTLENLVAGRVSAADCRALYRKAEKATFNAEPLLDSILIALKWAASDGTGEFMVGNVGDAIYAAAWERGGENTDAEVFERLRAIHDQYLGPYFKQFGQDHDAASSKLADEC